MAQPELTPPLALLEEAVTVLFCQVDDTYYRINPKGRRYETLKELSDSEVVTLALFQQLRGVESERSFLREVARFFSHLFPGVDRPSSLLVAPAHPQPPAVFGAPAACPVLPELVGEPETLIIDSTLLSVLHPRQVPQGSGFEGAAWVRWGSFSVYGVKLHLLCATNRVPLSYELSAANVAEVSLTEELLAEADLGEEVARKLLWGIWPTGARSSRRRSWPSRGYRAGHRRSRRETSRGKAADRDRLFEPQAGLGPRGNSGYHPRGVGEQDRVEDDGLHLRLSRQPDVGSAARSD